jgi:hypothetical protein
VHTQELVESKQLFPFPQLVPQSCWTPQLSVIIPHFPAQLQEGVQQLSTPTTTWHTCPVAHLLTQFPLVEQVWQAPVQVPQLVPQVDSVPQIFVPQLGMQQSWPFWQTPL